MNTSSLIKQRFIDSIDTKQLTLNNCHSKIQTASDLLINTLKQGNKILICGNGGSASDAQHFAAELIMRYETNRTSLPAIALTTDSSALTAISNDLNFDQIFQRQIEGLGNKHDLLIIISTSGNSNNIINAVKIAHQKSLNVLSLSGHNGGKVSNILKGNDVEIIVPSESTGRIQESHILIIHILCELTDQFWSKL